MLFMCGSNFYESYVRTLSIQENKDTLIDCPFKKVPMTHQKTLGQLL